MIIFNSLVSHWRSSSKTLLTAFLFVFWTSLGSAQTGAALDFGPTVIPDSENTGVVTVGQVSNVNDFTLEFLFKPDGEISFQNIFSIGGPTGRDNFLRLETSSNFFLGHLYTYGNYGNETLIPLSGTLQNQWYHIAFVGDKTNNQYSVYLDGVLVISRANTNWLATWPNLVLGKGFSSSAERDYNGLIDDFKLWDEVRSQAEIQASTNTTLAGTEPNLRIFYDFEEGVANGNNSATGGNVTQVINRASPGTLNGAVSELARTGTEGNWVNATTAATGLDFDGVNDYVNVGTNVLASANELTIETWYYPTASSPNWSRILDFGDNTSRYMFITTSVMNTGRPRFVITTAGSPNEAIITAPAALALNTWSHIAVTLTGTTATMYINGVQVAQELNFNVSPASLGATSNNWLGRSQYPADSYLQGSLDELRVWNTARTGAEIAANKDCALTGTESGLVGYYNFNNGDEGANNAGLTTLADQTSNGNDGTLLNFALNGATSNWVEGASISVTCSPVVGCDKFEIDSLSHGTVLNSYFQGMSLTVTPGQGGTNQAVIYDSDGTWPEDPDLNAGEGNFIIINENPNRKDGDNQGPDDNQNGGTMRFDFTAPVNIASILALDVQKGGQYIDVYDDNGTLLSTMEIPRMGNGALQMIPIRTDGVGRVDIRLNHSGAFRFNIDCNSVAPIPCTKYSLDQLQHGMIANNMFANDGLLINVAPGSGGTTNAVVYDTDGSWIEDPDLNAGVGNVIVINEDPNNNDGDNQGPDDNQNGGVLEYVFSNPVDVYSVLVVDVDKPGTYIVAYDAQNNTITNVSVPKGSDGGVQTVTVNALDVSRLEIVVQSSGGFRLNLDCSRNGQKSSVRASSIAQIEVLDGITAYPNPFSSEINLGFHLAQSGDVIAEVLALDGRVIREVYNGHAEAGMDYEMNFSADDLPAGVYFYKVSINGETSSVKRLILQR